MKNISIDENNKYIDLNIYLSIEYENFKIL